MSKLLKKTLAFVTVAMMFLSGTSVFAGEQLSGVDVTTDGPQAAVESEPVKTEDTLKAESPLEGEAVAENALKESGEITPKLLNYENTEWPGYWTLNYEQAGSYGYFLIYANNSGRLVVELENPSSYSMDVAVGPSAGNGDITPKGRTAYLSAGESGYVGNFAVTKGKYYYVRIKSNNNGSLKGWFLLFSGATRSLKAGKTMLAPGYKDGSYDYTSCLFKIKPTKSGYIKVTPKEYGYNPSAGYVTLLNKNKKTVSDKLWYYQGSNTSYVVFGVKKGVTYYIKATDFAGTSENYNLYGMKFTTTKATARSNTKKSKAKKLTRKANYISTVMAANGKSGSQWYKFKVTKKRKTVVKVNATNLKSGTVKAIVYCGSKKVGSTTISKGQVNTITVTYSTTYGKANKGTYYVKLTKSKKANGVYKIKYAQ